MDLLWIYMIGVLMFQLLCIIGLIVGDDFFLDKTGADVLIQSLLWPLSIWPNGWAFIKAIFNFFQR